MPSHQRKPVPSELMELNNMIEPKPITHFHIFIEPSLLQQTPPPLPNYTSLTIIKESFISILGRFHAGYFRISLSICSQALLLKILGDKSIINAHSLRRVFQMKPSLAFALIWSIAFFTIALLSFLYVLRCYFHFKLVKSEFVHHVGVNYLFAPWISWLFLLQSSPFLNPKSTSYLSLFWVFVAPILVLDVKIYGQWFTKGKKSLYKAANPTSQISVIGNLVGAQAAAQMGWRETSICLFALGMSHYLVLFVTLYQRLSVGNCIPTMLRPVFFLFIAAPSMSSLAWNSISGTFDNLAKILFFLSLFLFLSLVSRPTLFKKSTRKFNVVWWAYSFPLTILAAASADYAHEIKSGISHWLMIVLASLSVFAFLNLVVFTALNTNKLFPQVDPVLSPHPTP